MKYIQKTIASGYLLITLLIGCIAYIWYDEWQEVENLEADNRRIEEFRKSINNIHIQLIVQALNEQQTLNEKMAQQVPVIVQKNMQEHPQKIRLAKEERRKYNNER